MEQWLNNSSSNVQEHLYRNFFSWISRMNCRSISTSTTRRMPARSIRWNRCSHMLCSLLDWLCCCKNSVSCDFPHFSWAVVWTLLKRIDSENTELIVWDCKMALDNSTQKLVLLFQSLVWDKYQSAMDAFKVRTVYLEINTRFAFNSLPRFFNKTQSKK